MPTRLSPRTSLLPSGAPSDLPMMGSKFIKLQEDSARAAQEWFAKV